MEEITQGKGRAPKPFMLPKSSRGKKDAVWHSNRGEAADAKPATKATAKRAARPT
jgi:bifunctional non-homologous end joining protein LigD